MTQDTTTSAPDYGQLHDYETGTFIRAARREELKRSREAADTDGGRGVISVPCHAWRVSDGGAWVTLFADPGAGPAHDPATDDEDYTGDPCDCYRCNGTEVVQAWADRACYVVGPRVRALTLHTAPECPASVCDPT